MRECFAQGAPRSSTPMVSPLTFARSARTVCEMPAARQKRLSASAPQRNVPASSDAVQSVQSAATLGVLPDVRAPQAGAHFIPGRLPNCAS
jgi:hypothetical protein